MRNESAFPLRARGLGHAYTAGAPVFSEVDVRLDTGVPTALIGPNGAGKTTLLQCLAGLLEAHSGAVLVDGEPVASRSRREVARTISVVPQARPIAFAFSALEYVMMGRHPHSGRFTLEGPAERRRALDALEAMGVAALAERPMTRLSGGEAQRVILARTIASGAPYWLLDEPTANLDVAHRVAVLRTVRRHCAEGGLALAVVHDLNVVEQWFDRVMVLAGGSLIADGAPADVLTPALFERAFGQRMRRLTDGGRSAWVADLDPDDAPHVEHPEVDSGAGVSA